MVRDLVADRRRSALEESYVELLWRKCARDPQFFFETCIQIPSKRRQAVDGREPFVLFDYQQGDLEAFLDNQYVIVLKARQIGLSTLIGAYALWLALFQPGAVVLWVSNNQDNANKAVQMLDVMWTFLPDWFKARAPKMVSDQAGKKEWQSESGMISRIRAYAGTGTAGASETADLVVLDEFALIDGNTQDDLLRSAEPTTDAGGSLFIVSTARGGHNRFARTFRKAQKGESRYEPIFHPWYVSRFVNPNADLMPDCHVCGGDGRDGNGLCGRCVDTAGYEAKARDFSDKPWLMHAEYPADADEAFRESGNPRFTNLPAVTECVTGWVRGVMVPAEEVQSGFRFIADDDGALRVRRDVLEDGPDGWRDYVLYVDPSQGIGGDYTAAHLLTYDDDQLPEIAAWWWANDIEPVDSARRFDRLGRWFGGRHTAALLAIENTGGWGDSMINELNVHLRYPRLYAHRPTGKRKRTQSTKLGFPMHYTRRPLVIDRLAKYVTTSGGGPDLYGIHPQLRYELGTFVRTENGRFQADTGCHDDLVMSVAGGLWVLLEEGRATEQPKGEAVDPGDPEPTNDLSGMFERIDEVRQSEQARFDRAAKRMRRHLSRRRSRRTRAGARRR